MNPIIEVKNLHKKFGALHVLRGISFSISKGEVASIVGPSGAGKTTLLQIIGTLDRPESGSVSIAGTDPFTLKRSACANFRNKHIGFVFQFHQLLPEFTAQENVALSAMIGGQSKRRAMGRAGELLQNLGLQDRMLHKPAQLSGGEKQRIAVARALMNDPDVILADEPSGSLDTERKEELHNLFFDLCHSMGQTFVIVTHDLELAQRTHHCITLSDGVVLQDQKR